MPSASRSAQATESNRRVQSRLDTEWQEFDSQAAQTLLEVPQVGNDQSFCCREHAPDAGGSRHQVKFEIHLQRIGVSRVSEYGIPFTARVLQGGIYGQDIIAGRGIRDREYAESASLEALRRKLPRAVASSLTVTFTDLTKYNQPGSPEEKTRHEI